jgi:hypothetical protein
MRQNLYKEQEQERNNTELQIVRENEALRRRKQRWYVRVSDGDFDRCSKRGPAHRWLLLL